MHDLDTYNVDSPDDLAPTRRQTFGPDGGYVPGRCVGYTYDGACYCIECAEHIHIETSDGEEYRMDHFPADACDEHGFGAGVLTGFSETDYPGDSCHICHRRLPTTLLPREEW
jgi:hypothetical protein